MWGTETVGFLLFVCFSLPDVRRRVLYGSVSVIPGIEHSTAACEGGRSSMTTLHPSSPFRALTASGISKPRGRDLSPKTEPRVDGMPRFALEGK